MRHGLMRLAAAMGALSVVSINNSTADRDRAADLGPLFIPNNKRGKGQNNRRGKGKRSTPKKRPNRLTISKRVRRKHRRAA